MLKHRLLPLGLFLQLTLLHRSLPAESVSSEATARPQTALATGLLPEQAAQHMTAPPGFHVSLVAGEPDVHQPIAFAFDHRGRIWLAEAHTYPIRAPEGQGRDKIIILEDTDGDGRFENRKVFAEGLNLVSGLEVGFGGVWVGAVPYLLFIPDANADDRPDSEPQILLDGFGYHDTHETLNAFIWGPDGWLYGCHGVFTHSKVGRPGTPDEDRIPVNAGVWRYHPVKHRFEVFAWGTSNPWGVDFDQHGQAFITACVIPHLYHVIQGARYQRQGGQHFNPYVFDDIQTIADHAHYAGNIRDHAWWGNEPTLPSDTSEAGGGHAHCGAMIYLGDNWPDSYRGHLFMNNVHGNRVNMDVLARRGSGFVGHHGADFLFANDHWYRGINLKCGPDGTVYLIDWYDKNACHRTNPEIWDRTNGRVYRVAYGDATTPQVDLAKLSDDELVDLHTHKNQWFVRMARRMLQERARRDTLDSTTPQRLEQLVVQTDVPRALQAMWTLHALGHLSQQRLTWAMKHSSEYVRAWAIQLSLEEPPASPDLGNQLAELSRTEDSALVRLYLASALQRLPENQRWPIAEQLLSHGEDAHDHNLPLMIWYGIEPLVANDAARSLDLATHSKIPQVTRYILRRNAFNEAGLNLLASRLVEAADDDRRIILEEMVAAFRGRVGIAMPASWTEAYALISTSPQEDVRDLADRVAVAFGDRRVFPRMRATLADRQIGLAERQQALTILVEGRDPEAAPALLAALDQTQLRAAALRALAAYEQPAVPAEIIRRYSEFDEPTRRDAINTLSARPRSALALLEAIEQGRVPRRDLHAYNIRQLRQFDHEQLRQRIAEVWGTVNEADVDKQQRIAAWKQQLTAEQLATADVFSGRRLFEKTCASCHRLFGEGGEVGPEITGSNRADLDYLLENMVAPSAVVGKDYQMTVLVLADGRIVQGLVMGESDSGITLRTINDEVLIAKADIEEQFTSPLSLMPDGLLDTLAADEVRDLAAYLRSPLQVPLRGPRAPIDSQTGRVPGAIEGETMKIVEKTAGTAQPEHGQLCQRPVE